MAWERGNEEADGLAARPHITTRLLRPRAVTLDHGGWVHRWLLYVASTHNMDVGERFAGTFVHAASPRQA